MAGAKATLRAACLELWQNPSTDELLALIRGSPSEKRISPFLAFLGDGGPNNSLSDQDSAALQNWVIQKLAKQMRLVKNPSIAPRGVSPKKVRKFPQKGVLDRCVQDRFLVSLFDRLE